MHVYVWLNTYIVSTSLWLVDAYCVQLQSRLCDWLVGLVYLLEWIEDDVLLHSLPAN
jgi:hypothetical protein